MPEFAVPRLASCELLDRVCLRCEGAVTTQVRSDPFGQIAGIAILASTPSVSRASCGRKYHAIEFVRHKSLPKLYASPASFSSRDAHSGFRTDAPPRRAQKAPPRSASESLRGHARHSEGKRTSHLQTARLRCAPAKRPRRLPQVQCPKPGPSASTTQRSSEPPACEMKTMRACHLRAPGMSPSNRSQAREPSEGSQGWL